MQLPTIFRPTMTPPPPMYAWPPAIKRIVLALSILGVVVAYALLAGGVVAILAILANQAAG
jgi:hypothetical protein